MATSGFMTLAYMAELAVVVNLGYLELKSLRYIQSSRDSVSESLNQLNDRHKTNGGVGNDEFMDLYRQAKLIFDPTPEEREGAWYVASTKGKVWYKKSAKYIYGMFINDRDRKAATILLLLSGLSIFVITLIDRVGLHDGLQSNESCIWWTVFGVLSFGIGIPTLLVGLGRYLAKVVEQISKSIQVRKNSLASGIIDSKINQTVADKTMK